MHYIHLASPLQVFLSLQWAEKQGQTYFLQNQLTFTQSCYLPLVLRSFPEPAPYICVLVLESTHDTAMRIVTKIARNTFQFARFPTNLGRESIIHFTLIPTSSPSISRDVSSVITYSPSCDALWIETDKGSETISRTSRYVSPF